MSAPKGGMDVPDEPVAPVGLYLSHDAWVSWYGRLTPSAFNSALRANVFDVKPMGPRGGKYYAVQSEWNWRVWAEKYRQRVQAQLGGRAARRLGYDG